MSHTEVAATLRSLKFLASTTIVYAADSAVISMRNLLSSTQYSLVVYCYFCQRPRTGSIAGTWSTR